jgi:hypothetical protein
MNAEKEREMRGWGREREGEEGGRGGGAGAGEVEGKRKRRGGERRRKRSKKRRRKRGRKRRIRRKGRRGRRRGKSSDYSNILQNSQHWIARPVPYSVTCSLDRFRKELGFVCCLFVCFPPKWCSGRP